jgi:hypothetical protein
MNPDAYWYVLVASITGGVSGALVMWNRKRSQTVGESKPRSFAVHVPLNIYPILHLRYVTYRVEGCLARMPRGAREFPRDH